MKTIYSFLFVALLLVAGNLAAQSDTPPECLNLGEIQQKIGYPIEAKRAGAHGKVIAKVTVGKNGKVEQSEIMESPSPILSKAVLSHIGGLKFKAAKMDGKPSKSIVQVPIIFENTSAPKVYTSLEKALTTLNLVESLDLSGQKLDGLDKRISRLKSLRSIVLDDNNFDRIPSVLKKLPALEEIEIANNKVTKIPCYVKKMKNLKVLNVSGNPLTTKAVDKAHDSFEHLTLEID